MKIKSNGSVPCESLFNSLLSYWIFFLHVDIYVLICFAVENKRQTYHCGPIMFIQISVK